MFPMAHGVASQAAPASGGGGGGITIVSHTTGGANPFATSHSVALPSGSGGLLVVIARIAGAVDQGWNTPAGWTKLLNSTDGTGGLAVFYRTADGTEPGTLTFTVTGGGGGALIAYRVIGTAGIEGAVTGINAGDPPALSPSWGSAECLWIAIDSTRRTDNTFSSLPTNYSNQVTAKSPTTSSSTNYAHVSAGTRLLTASSENPGAFGRSGTFNGTYAATLALKAA